MTFNTSVFAEDNIRKIISPVIKGEVLYIKGTIDSHIYDFFSYNHGNLKNVKTVSLNSYGGSHYWALEIVRKIQEHKLNTLLDKDNFCASACLYLYGAGKVRSAHKNTWFGIHGARLAKGNSVMFLSACYFENERGLYQFDMNIEGCKSVHDKFYQLALRSTKEAFQILEDNGVSPRLIEDYLSLEEDRNWPFYFNVLKIKDWVVSAQLAQEYDLVTQLID